MQLPKSITNNPQIAQLFILCTVASNYFDQDYLFEAAVNKHINLLMQYNDAPFDLSQFVGLTPTLILKSEIVQAKTLLNQHWKPFAQNKAQLKSLFMMTSLPLYSSFMKGQILYNNFATTPIAEICIFANTCCIDFFNGITFDYENNP